MVKGCPGKQAGGLACGREAREGMCLFGLLERDSVFFLWNLDIKLLGNDAQLGKRNR